MSTVLLLLELPEQAARDSIRDIASTVLKNFFILRLPLFFLHAAFWERQLVTYLQLQYKTYDAFLQQKVYIFRIFEYKIGNLF